MSTKIQKIELATHPQYESIKYRLVEVALYDWLDRTIGIHPRNWERMFFILRAYGMEADLANSVLATIEALAPNKLEYALLYNQIENVPKKESLKVLRVSSTNPSANCYTGLVVKATQHLPIHTYKPIQRLLGKTNKQLIDYKPVEQLQLQTQEEGQ